MKGESQMIITVTIDTDDMTFCASDENEEIYVEYNECDPEEVTVKEIINDFLTWLLNPNVLYYIQKVKENTKPERNNAHE